MKKEQIKHSERAHALLSASGSSRWLNCTPSARLEEQFEDKQSEAAAEGTLAHELAEAKVRAVTTGDKKGLASTRKTIKDNKFYCEDMENHTDTYTGYVMEVYNESKARDEAAVIETEVRVNYSHYVPEGFGTVDNVVIGGGVMDVIDFKYGKGVKVEATENPQLKLYGLGALEEYAFLHEVGLVRLHIHQPRLDHISVFEIAATDLIDWAEEEVTAKAALAFDGLGEQVTGSWCQFCKAKAQCRALGAEALSVAKADFEDPLLLSDEELVDIYQKADRITRYLSSLGKHMLEQALAGKKWDGFKVVEGRSVRKLKDEEAVAQILEDNNYVEEDFLIKKLQGITALEKLLTKKGFAELLGDQVIKPAGKPTLVSADDKRQEINLASDFDDE